MQFYRIHVYHRDHELKLSLILASHRWAALCHVYQNNPGIMVSSMLIFSTSSCSKALYICHLTKQIKGHLRYHQTGSASENCEYQLILTNKAVDMVVGCTQRASSLGQSHSLATTGAWPYRVRYLSMWACVCLIFKPHWMFQIYLRVTKKWPLVQLSCLVTCFRC